MSWRKWEAARVHPARMGRLAIQLLPCPALAKGEDIVFVTVTMRRRNEHRAKPIQKA